MPLWKKLMTIHPNLSKRSALSIAIADAEIRAAAATAGLHTAALELKEEYPDNVEKP